MLYSILNLEILQVTNLSISDDPCSMPRLRFSLSRIRIDLAIRTKSTALIQINVPIGKKNHRTTEGRPILGEKCVY